MAAKVKIYTPDGHYVGYFVDAAIEAYPEAEYEITGTFFDETGTLTGRLDFNPESMPYTADLSEVEGAKHVRLINVYVQRGRQPVRVSGVGANG